jgi:glycosyltransferase involved in cell wall biosynthesis
LILNAGVPKVSIAMPVRNAEATVAAAIRSIVLQTWRDWELLVIDDGSTDATRQVVTSFGDPRVRLVDGGANRGLAARLNQAISMARAPLFARMDGDDIAYPLRLEAQVEFLAKQPGCDLVGCGALFFDDAGDIKGRYPLRRTHAEICLDPWRGFFLPHPTWMGRRDWFARFGYLESYRKTQDQDLLLRSFDSSSFACVDRTLLGYRQERRTLGKSLRGRAYFSRSIAREALKRRAWLAGCGGVAAQAAKALADLMTIPFGMDGWLRGGGAAIAGAELQEWETVWKACNMGGQQ